MNSTVHGVDVPMQIELGWLDLSIFIIMLFVSTLIGVYFGYWGKKEDTPREYLLGGRTMGTIPVSVSLAASFLSGIFVMGIPAEIYLYGVQICLAVFPTIISGLLTNYIYLPVLYALQLTSMYEYLELRFDRNVRIMASVLFMIKELLHLPVILYVPALALSQGTGLNLFLITSVTSFICIFYTALGGIKAVIWTDLIQQGLLFIEIVVVLIVGVLNIGGLSVVWETMQNGGRIFVDLSPSPIKRLSVWNIVIGKTFQCIGVFFLSQTIFQKYVSLPTYSKARTALISFNAQVLIIFTCNCIIGAVIYATYYKCDPISTKAVSKPDQLLPYFVTDIGSFIPGLPGLFIAGIFSAALSSISSILNALAACTYEDFIRPCLRRRLTDKCANNIMRGVVVFFGIICALSVIVVDRLGKLIQIHMSLTGVGTGAVVGLYSFGMLFPRGNSKGALAGSICSLLIMAWIVIGNERARSEGRIEDPFLPTSTEGCNFNITVSDAPKSDVLNEDVFYLYRVSFMYYVLIGTIVMILVGTAVSLLTKSPEHEKMNPAFFASFLRTYVILKNKSYERTEQNEMKLLRNVST